jgi:hypothetical protein
MSEEGDPDPQPLAGASRLAEACATWPGPPGGHWSPAMVAVRLGSESWEWWGHVSVPKTQNKSFSDRNGYGGLGPARPSSRRSAGVALTAGTPCPHPSPRPVTPSAWHPLSWRIPSSSDST